MYNKNRDYILKFSKIHILTTCFTNSEQNWNKLIRLNLFEYRPSQVVGLTKIRLAIRPKWKKYYTIKQDYFLFIF